MKAAKNESSMKNSERIAILETTILNINTTLLDLRQEMKYRFDKIDDKFDTLQNRLWSNFLWLMGMIIGLAGLIAHTQHWI